MKQSSKMSRHIPGGDCAPLKGGLCFIERLEELSLPARDEVGASVAITGAPPHVSTPLLPQQPTSSNAWSLPANVVWRTPKVRPQLIAYSPSVLSKLLELRIHGGARSLETLRRDNFRRNHNIFLTHLRGS